MRFIRNFILVVLFCLAASPALAVTSPWQEGEQLSARLIASRHTSGQSLSLGLQLNMKGHWHVYWRSPGDAGLPPQLDWSKSENLASTTIRYPLPKLESLQGLNTYGYGGEVVFPIDVTAVDATKPVKLVVKLNVLVCDDICVPANFDLALELPPAAQWQEADNSEESTLLERFWKLVPFEENNNARITSATLVKEGEKNLVRLGYTSPSPLTDVEVIAEPGDGSTLAIVSSIVQPTEIVVEVTDDEVLKQAAGKEVTFTLVDKTGAMRATEKKLALVANVPPMAVTPEMISPAPAAALPNLGAMILLALLGGLILNLMPCVLPVLAIKSLSFVSHGGGTPKGVRLSFLVTSAGILFSFLVMACVIIGLKEAGMSVGWGVQFQHPAFLIPLVVIIIAFALNLWGLFEIPLPRFMADRLSWTQGHGNLVKDFFSGAFATLLATPCTAPFLGTAVGFALAAGASEILAIFLALGLGLSAPYLLIAAFPAIATWLPKPGAWMNVLKKILALTLAITAAWLIYVLAVQNNAATNNDAGWQEFDRAKITGYVREGKIVFVDVTAEWCLTCKANKKFVLDTEEMKQALHKDNIVLLRADWTKPSETIASYLKEYGRFGIPFNVVYGPGAPAGHTLPELLTKQAVLDGLAAAEKR